MQQHDLRASVFKACAAYQQAVAKSVSAAELNRAKKQTIAAVFSNLENHSIIAEDIGRQLLTYGERCGRYTAAGC